MTVIHVNFKKSELYSVKKDVIDKLDEWGLNPDELKVPKDAIACALDEVRLYETYQERNEILLQLEDMLANSKT